MCVNLPRWGLKRLVAWNSTKGLNECKFTPLGFETSDFPSMPIQRSFSVNLPRWGLKHSSSYSLFAQPPCKFTPLGFETVHR